MATAQQQDAEVEAYRTSTLSFQLEDISFGTKVYTLLCDMSTGDARPIVPAGWRRWVFDMILSLSPLSAHYMNGYRLEVCVEWSVDNK